MAKSYSGERVSGIGQRLVRDAGIKLRRGDGRSAHGLRALAASETYDACQDPLVVAEYLGHVNLATLRIYLRRQGVQRVRDALDLRFAA